MKYPAYPKYKPSGVEWLGEVPEHWEFASLKWKSRLYAGGTPDRTNDSYWDEGTIPWINSGAVNQKLIIEPSTYITEEGYRNSSTNWVQKGALVMALAGQGKTKGMVAQVAIDTTCNQSMAAIVPFDCSNARFLFWWFSHQYETIRNLAGGEQRDGLNLEILGSLSIPVFPINEQRAIADFLDRETAKLDTLVTKKRELIEKLKEKRTALISRTVTRGLPPEAARAAGLNPQPKLKPSGIEWLGEVPEHWEVKPLRYIFYNLDHKRIPIAAEDRTTVEKTFPYYGASGIIDYVDDYIFDEPLILVAEDGANLLSRSSPLAFLAKGKYWVNNHAHILKPRNGSLKYWEGVLQSFDYTPLVTGAAQPKLTSERLGNIRLPSPPVSEQRAIADYLDRETAKIDQMAAKVEEALARLQEYRTALITAAVTGKIEVRG